MQRSPPLPADEEDVDEASLSHIRKEAARARDLTLEIKDVEQRLKDLNNELHYLLREKLPMMLIASGVDHLGVPPEGNAPPFDLALSGYYKANIAVSWPPEKKAAAFDILKEKGASDIIRSKVEVSLPGKDQAKVEGIVQVLREAGFVPQVTESVPWATLTAWLKESCENDLRPTDAELQALGADVGHIVKIKERTAT